MKYSSASAIRHMLFSTFCFALMNVCIKQVPHIPAMEIVFVRCAISLLLCLYALRESGESLLGHNHLLLFLRGLFGTGALYFFFITISQMPLATAVTIQYTSPIFTTLLATVLNNERVKPIQWVCFAISFGGIVMLKGFNFDVPWWWYAAGLFSAFCSGVAYNLVRNLKVSEHPMVVVLHFQIVGTVVGSAFTAFSFVLPQKMDWLYLVLIGVLTQLGQVNLTKALQAEKLGIISSLNYLGIVYAIGFGVLFFGEHLGMQTFLAICMVVSGVLLNVFFGRRSSKAAVST